MRLRALLIPVALLALLLGAWACGGDDDDDDATDNGDVPAEATDAPGDGDDDPTDEPDNGGDDDDDNGGIDAPNPFSEGSATLTIGAESWDFDGIFCAFSTEESRNDNVPFTLTAFGTSSTGARTQLDASVVDLSGAAEVSGENLSVTLNDVDDFENPSIGWSSNTFDLLGGQVPTLNIDGKSVSIEAVFDDELTEDETEAIPGTLVAECP